MNEIKELTEKFSNFQTKAEVFFGKQELLTSLLVEDVKNIKIDMNVQRRIISELNYQSNTKKFIKDNWWKIALSATPFLIALGDVLSWLRSLAPISGL